VKLAGAQAVTRLLTDRAQLGGQLRRKGDRWYAWAWPGTASARQPFSRLNLIGADIVEVAPAYDHAQITGISAAHAGYELLSALAAAKAAP